MLESVRSVLAIPAVYQLWTNAVGGSNFVRALVNEHIQPGAETRTLDIGCGPGTFLRYLPQSGYFGFDSSSEYIEQGRRQFPQAQFLCERVSNFTLLQSQKFDLAIAIGIVHHLDDAEAAQLFQIAYNALVPGGKLVTVDGVFTQDQSPAARWLLARDRGQYVRKEHEYLSLASTVFQHIKPIVRSDLLRIPYTHLILECVRPAPSEESLRSPTRLQ
jgi:SAM-dependent methyltransferase